MLGANSLICLGVPGVWWGGGGGSSFGWMPGGKYSIWVYDRSQLLHLSVWQQATLRFVCMTGANSWMWVYDRSQLLDLGV